jgi:hypothetical protein
MQRRQRTWLADWKPSVCILFLNQCGEPVLQVVIDFVSSMKTCMCFNHFRLILYICLLTYYKMHLWGQLWNILCGIVEWVWKRVIIHDFGDTSVIQPAMQYCIKPAEWTAYYGTRSMINTRNACSSTPNTAVWNSFFSRFFGTPVTSVIPRRGSWNAWNTVSLRHLAVPVPYPRPVMR